MQTTVEDTLLVFPFLCKDQHYLRLLQYLRIYDIYKFMLLFTFPVVMSIKLSNLLQAYRK